MENQKVIKQWFSETAPDKRIYRWVS